ncbi:hypothetical protein VP01_525g8 [Puccinia sorghi]|uniref:Plastocyanin-like domain-containing protein n=1 Tax=Puccinia sorghi TaxID=27349 RepID=A0A0L6UKH7_9BASI|nr:hypothetical protein VP01_525g8 [Puccinia sorghi]
MTLLPRPALLVVLVTISLTQQVRETSSRGALGRAPLRPRPYFVPVYVPYGPRGQTHRGFSPVNNPPSFGPPFPSLPPPLLWDARLPFEKGLINITDFNTGKPVFTIQNRNNDHHRSFEVVNLTGDALVEKTAQSGFDFTYHTPSGVSYTIHPRGAKTDRWFMQMQGNDPDLNYQNLIYFRGHTKNVGNVYFRNYSRVATFTFDAPKNRTYLAGAEKTVKLEILCPTNIGSQYFIGLWATVKLRMDKYGS